jgi:chaperonin GroEL
MKEVGRDGVITVEDAKGFKTSLDVVEGMEINRGYVSPYFITDQGKMSVVMDNPLVLLLNKKITTLNDVLPVLERVHESKRPLLIIADDIEGEALQGLVLNKVKGTLNVCAIKSPEFGETRHHAMTDLGIMLGAEVFTDADDMKSVALEHLGKCKKLVVSKNQTTFVDCVGSQANIEKRALELREMIDEAGATSPERDALSRRLSRLSGGVAILRVGAATEIELAEKRDRVEDALHATQAAVDEGILPGGGIALVRASKTLDNMSSSKMMVGVQVGIDIVKKACAAPLSQIVDNSGSSSQIVLEKILKSRDDNKGYDAYNDEYVNMLEAGIIDPLKVVRSALEHASSAACNLLSVGCAMIEDDSEASGDDSFLMSMG